MEYKYEKMQKSLGLNLKFVSNVKCNILP